MLGVLQQPQAGSDSQVRKAAVNAHWRMLQTGLSAHSTSGCMDVALPSNLW